MNKALNMVDKSAYQKLLQDLTHVKYTWLVTGVAGFIGSHLLEGLLKLNQTVIGLDNFDTGHRKNLDEVMKTVTPGEWANFRFYEGDIRSIDICNKVCQGVDYVLHHAALSSVSRSIEDPLATNSTNVTGFLNMLLAARDAKVKRFIYAASSSTYGDHPGLPKVENIIGNPLSPYAVTKLINEIYADIFAKTYGLNTIGLRYFNIFGPRQDPNGAYAAVMPKWIDAMIDNQPIFINGDGETSRDFCYVANVVQANMLAAQQSNLASLNQIYNISYGDKVTLNELFHALKTGLAKHNFAYPHPPIYQEFRIGDVRHSQADITKAKKILGYEPSVGIESGVEMALSWYVKTKSP